MNNSFFAVNQANLSEEMQSLKPKDNKPQLREQQEKLLKLISAIEGLGNSADFSSLKEMLFSGIQENLTNQILEEARKSNPDTLKLSRLSGRLETIEQYDLGKLKERYWTELQDIKRQLNA